MPTFPLKIVGQYGFNPRGKIIGKTANSTVFLGFRLITEQEVAIKIIPTSFLQQDINRKLLKAQIDLMFDVKGQQNLIQIYDCYETTNNIYIIMEFCKHLDLQKYIQQFQKAREYDSVSLMEQIISGYLQLQAHGIIHRDLKLANIFMNSEEKLKIADFGYSIRANTNLNEGIVKTEENVGSPLYMAPQVFDKNQYSYKSDIWSLGVIFYELLFKQAPWNSHNQDGLKWKLKNISIQKVLENKQIQQRSKQFLMKALQIDFHKRMNVQEISEFRFRGYNFTQKQQIDDKSQTTSIGQSENISFKFQPNQPKTINRKSILDRSNHFQLGKRVQSKVKNAHTSAFSQVSQKTYNQKRQCQNQSQIQHIPSQIAEENQSAVSNSFCNTPRHAIFDTQSKSSMFLTNSELKRIQNQIAAQIHFCRYLHKFHDFLRKQNTFFVLSNGLKEQLFASIEQFVLKRMEQIKLFKDFSIKTANSFKLYGAKQFNRINKIRQTYENRFLKAQSWGKTRLEKLFSHNRLPDQKIFFLLNKLKVSDSFSFNPEQQKDRYICQNFRNLMINLIDLLRIHIEQKIDQQIRGAQIQMQHRPTIRPQSQAKIINEKINMLKFFDEKINHYLKQVNG